jgi:hypothetical protein
MAGMGGNRTHPGRLNSPVEETKRKQSTTPPAQRGTSFEDAYFVPVKLRSPLGALSI